MALSPTGFIFISIITVINRNNILTAWPPLTT
nr:MAG TPA: hypothetical protein [Caudoviricetes sp.]